MALRIEECRRAVRGIRAQAAGDAQAEYEAILLDASLARAEGDLAESARCLERARAFQARAGLPPHFHWDFQSANNAYLQGQFGSALELFLRARSRAQDPFESAVAVGSGLLCCEALGLPLDGRLEELEPLAAKVADPLRRESLDEQLEAFRMRESWRRGRPAEIWRRRDVSSRAQSRWMQAWAAELPFMAPPAGRKPWRIEDLDPEMHAFRYRVGTLTGVAAADESGAKVQLKAERLYLWTWRWLRDADEASLRRVENALASLTLHELRNQGACDDLQLISLSLLWLAAFFPSARAAIERGLSRFEPPGTTWPPGWEVERALAAAMAQPGRMRRRAIARALEKPEARAEGFRWQEAVDRVLSARPQGRPPQARPSTGLSVELAANRVCLGSPASPRAAAISPPLCRLFASLAQEPTPLDFGEALEACFGIAPYEADVHRAKIHNLLARARKFLPHGARLISRGDVIYRDGDWSAVALRDGERPLQLPAWFRARAEMAAATKHLDRWIRPSAVLKHAKPGRDLTRQEMQRLANCSRATAHRLLVAWEKQGLIVRKGKGKRARYEIQLAP